MSDLLDSFTLESGGHWPAAFNSFRRRGGFLLLILRIPLQFSAAHREFCFEKSAQVRRWVLQNDLLWYSFGQLRGGNVPLKKEHAVIRFLPLFV